MNKILLKLLLATSDRRADDWNVAIKGILDERVKSLPEVAVVESLRAYLDGLWGPPDEGKRLWSQVLASLRTLDIDEIKRNEEFLQKLSNKFKKGA